jgi:hypothetical protein
VLIPSRDEDPPERIRFGDGQFLVVPGHGAAIKLENGNVYLAIALRNGGTGLGVIHGWRARATERTDSVRPELSEFRRQTRDLYIPAGETGFWQGAIRDRDDPSYDALRVAAGHAERRRVMVDLLYGDHEGGQRTIARFSISDWQDVEGERAEALRYWNLDRDDPR